MAGTGDLEDLQKLLAALEPYLDRVVIIGGWAHRLYRFVDEVVAPPYEPIYTTDTDVAIPQDAGIPHDDLAARLKAHGFVGELRGDDRPPITHYHLGSVDSGYYAEFLTPKVRTRSERQRDTAVVGGVVAQVLPHLDILTIDPWPVRVQAPQRIEPFVVAVPNPVAYIAQKLIVLKDRRREDRSKDLLYINDTLELFGNRLEQLHRDWRERVEPALGRRGHEVIALAKRHFAAVSDDLRRAVEVAGRRPNLDAEVLQARCEIGLREILSQ